MIVAQMIQMNREIAAGNGQIMGAIAGQIQEPEAIDDQQVANQSEPAKESNTIEQEQALVKNAPLSAEESPKAAERDVAQATREVVQKPAGVF